LLSVYTEANLRKKKYIWIWIGLSKKRKDGESNNSRIACGG
jgi:hypothetical protein